MEITDYMLWKAIVLLGIAFVGNFIYSFTTGKSLSQERTDKPQGPRDPPAG